MQQKPHVGIRLADHNTHCQIRRGKCFQHLKLKKNDHEDKKRGMTNDDCISSLSFSFVLTLMYIIRYIYIFPGIKITKNNIFYFLHWNACDHSKTFFSWHHQQGNRLKNDQEPRVFNVQGLLHSWWKTIDIKQTNFLC